MFVLLQKKTVPPCLMSKRFGKHCRGNAAWLHLGGAQPRSLVAAEQRGTPEPGVLLVTGGWLRAWGCSRPGVQGTSRAEAAPGRTEPLSPTQHQPVEPCHSHKSSVKA